MDKFILHLLEHILINESKMMEISMFVHMSAKVEHRLTYFGLQRSTQKGGLPIMKIPYIHTSRYLGKGMTSLMLSIPVANKIILSKPKPNPLCLTVPNLRSSRYQ
ncbi:hypothetical protein DsansV1_C07g0070651 [Dioscorea sansibarensis]